MRNTQVKTNLKSKDYHSRPLCTTPCQKQFADKFPWLLCLLLLAAAARRNSGGLQVPTHLNAACRMAEKNTPLADSACTRFASESTAPLYILMKQESRPPAVCENKH